MKAVPVDRAVDLCGHEIRFKGELLGLCTKAPGHVTAHRDHDNEDAIIKRLEEGE